MTEPLAELTIDVNPSSKYALFLDFDGTLVEIARRPEEVQLDSFTRRALIKLDDYFSGALAIVTGREIGDLDQFLHPLTLPVAGVHGLTRRSADGRIHCRNQRHDNSFVVHVLAFLQPFVDLNAGLQLETKSHAVALHYRRNPELEEACIQAMRDATRDLSGYHVVRGKMVIEAKIEGGNKGAAVADFLSETPFAGRKPIFAGDDLTDEDAFQEVNRRHGISIKVGLEGTCAGYRADTTIEFLAWLQNLAESIQGGRKFE
jgi:trehalose 6-phosphate phosphatase